MGPCCFSAERDCCGRRQGAGGARREGEAEVGIGKQHRFCQQKILNLVVGPSRTEAERQKNATLAKKLESTQEDLMKTQIKYVKDVFDPTSIFKSI